MSNPNRKNRDKQITREIHRLFWRADRTDTPALILCYVTRIPAVAAFNILIPLVSAYAIQAIVAKDMDKVQEYALWIIALAIGYCILWAIGGVAIIRSAIKGVEYLQNRVFSNYISKDYEFYGNAFFGSLGAQAARLIDAYNVYGELTQLSGPKQATIVIVGIAVIGYQSPLLAVVTFIAMAVVLSFTIISSQWRLRYRREVGQAKNTVAGIIGDALSHGTTVKSYATETYELKRLQGPIKTLSKVQSASWSSSIPSDLGRMLLASIATAILLILSARLYIEGSITLTIVILIQLYVIKLIAVTFDIAEMIKRYEEAMGMAYEPVRTMLIPQSITDKPTAKPIQAGKSHHLSLQDVTFTYEGTKKPAIANFSLQISPGEKVGIVGYSGSGKTTLTKLLLRFTDVTGGSISIDDIDIRDTTQRSLRETIGYVPQEPLLFHRSIFENIQYGNPKASDEAIKSAITAAYVNEFANSLPDGYDTVVGEHGVKLSGGQRQRVAIARALLKDAPILLLDEATSALDSRSEQYIQKALWKLMKGRTAIVIAHRLSTIQRMDRIVVLDKGRLVQSGTHEQLLQETGIYADLWAHQSGGYIGVPAKPVTSDDENTAVSSGNRQRNVRK